MHWEKYALLHEEGQMCESGDEKKEAWLVKKLL
jgi:hypothetical protein